MKSKILMTAIAAIAFIYKSHSQNKWVSGYINDASTGEKLTGVVVFCPDIKLTALTDTTGFYELKNLPDNSLRVQVSLLGYETKSEVVDVSATHNMNFELQPAITELREVLITGNAKAEEKNRMPVAASLVSSAALRNLSVTNAVDAISTLPGISQISTGPAISKPVIRGLGYNRVAVVYNGIRQEGQQWGDEHGIEISPYGLGRIEVIKGPAGLMYGSDAMAGVIHFISAAPLANGNVNGQFTTEYQTNNGLAGVAAEVRGTNGPFYWGANGSTRQAHAYKNRTDGYVFNSGFFENSGSCELGYQKNKGVLRSEFSIYTLKTGIVETERDTLGNLIKMLALNDTTAIESIPATNDFMSYKMFTPLQRIRHWRASVGGNYYTGRGQINAQIAWQMNQRSEYDNVFSPNEYALSMNLHSVHYSLLYQSGLSHGYSFSSGLSGMFQFNRNKGNEYLIPDYAMADGGLFFIGKKSCAKTEITIGARIDTRVLQALQLYEYSDGTFGEFETADALIKFAAINKTLVGWSGSAGITHAPNAWLLFKYNFSRGYRAPNIAELSSNGEHEGSGRYEIGNDRLKAEGSFQNDLIVGLHSEHADAELDLFHNFISHYTYKRKLSNSSGADSLRNDVEVFRYQQGNAQLFGGEFRFDIHPHPLDWLHFENTFSYVRGIQLSVADTERNLPMIPQPKLMTELRGEWENCGKWLGNLYASVAVEQHFAQKKFYEAYQTETATASYTLLNASAGVNVINSGRKVLFSIVLNAKNLLNKSYQDHLSRLKYGSVNPANNKYGVFNMGRNFSVKIIVPVPMKE